MSLRCLFLRHRPQLNSIIVRDDRFTALCEHCSAPLVRDDARRWVGAAPLTSSRDQIA